MGGKEPILIYLGSDICYNVLNEFALRLGTALQGLGETVEYYDVAAAGESGLSAYAGRRFRAVIGFQSYLFDIYLPKAGVYLHDFIEGPKFNFQFDHPIWMNQHYQNLPKDCYILTHDRDYAAFIKRYYPRAAGAYLLPPGGVEAAGVDAPGDPGVDVSENAGAGDITGNYNGALRRYEVSFVGTYTDYRKYLPAVYGSSGLVRRLAMRFLSRMRRCPNETAEAALREAMGQLEINCGKAEFLGAMDGLKTMIYCIMSYYRERVVEVLLAAGISLEVFGDSWKNSPFGAHPCLHIHPAVSPEESLTMLERSRVSLNVMAWHKDGFTERIANSMLHGSVVCTDKSRYLTEQFRDGEELLLYDLEQLDILPERIQSVLADETKRQAMAQAAYDKAIRQHTWKTRAEEFLRRLQEL